MTPEQLERRIEKRRLYQIERRKSPEYKAWRKAWRAKNKDKIRESAAKYHHSEKGRATIKARLLRLKEEGGEGWQKLIEKWRRQRRQRTEWKLRAKLNIKAAPGEAFITALHSNDLYAVVSSCVSRSLPRHIRDDVISSMVLDVLEGKLYRKDLGPKAARRYVTAYNREFETYATRSLDADLGDGFTLLDTLIAEEPTPEEALTA
jgi:hypothetical protein